MPVGRGTSGVDQGGSVGVPCAGSKVRMALPGRNVHDLGMQVVSAPTQTSGARALAFGRLGVGFALLGVGVVLAYLAFATPIAEHLIPQARTTAPIVVLTALGWTLLLVAPAMAAIAGFLWIMGALERIAALRGAQRGLSALTGVLGDEYAAATNVCLPDGRIVAELVVGPHGVAVFDWLPPSTLSRVTGGAWELQIARNRWVPIENPFDRAVRTADRVRRWLSSGERDYVIKVHAALIASDASVGRTAACAVITREQVPAFLASLPAQRSFNEDRRAQVLEALRSAV